jgi:hypothetical protein
MLFFRSEEHVVRWSRAQAVPSGAILTRDQIWQLASAWYGDRMEPGWRRRSPAEAQRLFADLDLTGPFWQLSP